MPGERFGSRKPYLSIIQGTLKQKVTPETKDAERRDYELKDGTKGTKYELSFKSWRGVVQDLRLKEGEYGETLEVEFEDAILTINTDSRYFNDFVKKLVSADISKEIEVSPFDFESEGKKLTGVSIYQQKNGERVKLENHFWNDKDKKSCNGMPIPSGDTNRFKKDDWKMYFILVKKFLVAQLLKINEKIEEESLKTAVDSAIDDEIPTINPRKKEEEVSIPEAKEEEEENEIKLEDIPF